MEHVPDRIAVMKPENKVPSTAVECQLNFNTNTRECETRSQSSDQRVPNDLPALQPNQPAQAKAHHQIMATMNSETESSPSSSWLQQFLTAASASLPSQSMMPTETRVDEAQPRAETMLVRNRLVLRQDDLFFLQPGRDGDQLFGTCLTEWKQQQQRDQLHPVDSEHASQTRSTSQALGKPCVKVPAFSPSVPDYHSWS
jgi:hypothetical protein